MEYDMSIEGGETMTIKDTAFCLNMKVRTIREWIRKGKIKAEKLNGSRMWNIPQSEIYRIIHEREDNGNDN